MGLGKLIHCFVADHAHPQSDGKFTLIGTYGVCPHVAVSALSFPAEVRLSFVFDGGRTTPGTTTIQFELIEKASGAKVLETGPIQMQAPPPDLNRTLVVAELPVTYPRPGEYVIVLNADGKRHFEAEYTLRQGPGGRLVTTTLKPSPPPQASPA